MNMWIALLVALVGYLVGAISFARILGNWLVPEEDISKTEYELPDSDKKYTIHSVSAISLAFRTGPRVGCLVSILDMLKAFIPTFILWRTFPETYYHLIVAAAAIAGHNFPIYYRFKGGRGMSALYGSLLVIDWLAIPATVIGAGLLGLGVLRDLFLAYTGGIILLLPWLWFRFRSWQYILFALAVNVFFWVAMRPELRDHLANVREAKLRGEPIQINFKEFSKQWMGRKKEEDEQVDVGSKEDPPVAD